MTVRTQPNPRLIPEGDKRFPFPPGWVHPIEGPHSGMHHMTTRKPKPQNPATATSASKVVSLRETAPSIEPEEGWTKATAEGEHLIAGQGDSDRRLVQLSTVFRWAVDRSDAPPHLLPWNRRWRWWQTFQLVRCTWCKRRAGQQPLQRGKRCPCLGGLGMLT
jgi:hypothetical protein